MVKDLLGAVALVQMLALQHHEVYACAVAPAEELLQRSAQCWAG